MTTFRRIKRSRRIVAGSAGLVTATAAITLALGVLPEGGPGILQGVATLAAIALPAVFALLSLDGRPSLLVGAVMAALVSGVLSLVLLPAWLVVAIIWGWVAKARPRPVAEPRWAWFGRPLLAAAVAVPIVLMFSHLDPVCTIDYADGRVEQIDAATRGYTTGWRLGAGSTFTSSDSGSDITAETCSSDTVVWWEAALSLLATSGIVVAAFQWPTGHELADDPNARNRVYQDAD